MTQFSHCEVVCPSCGKIGCEMKFQSVNTTGKPKLKMEVAKWELYTWVCPKCGKKYILSYPSLINDNGTMWVFTAHFSEELAARGYSGEIVIDDDCYDPVMALIWEAWDKEK